MVSEKNLFVNLFWKVLNQRSSIYLYVEQSNVLYIDMNANRIKRIQIIMIILFWILNLNNDLIKIEIYVRKTLMTNKLNFPIFGDNTRIIYKSTVHVQYLM